MVGKEEKIWDMSLTRQKKDLYPMEKGPKAKENNYINKIDQRCGQCSPIKY